VPPPSPSGLAAVEAAVRASGVDLAPVPAAYASPWRRAGLAEACDGRLEGGYPLSPRNRRGATRA
jgi:hypothetical protein